MKKALITILFLVLGCVSTITWFRYVGVTPDDFKLSKEAVVDEPLGRGSSTIGTLPPLKVSNNVMVPRNKDYPLALGGSSTVEGEIRLQELSGNGNNYVGFQSPSTLSANVMWTLPTGDSSGYFKSDGSGNVTLDSPAGSGDITDIYNCPSGDCNDIAMADGDRLDASAVNVSSTSEGIFLPQSTSCLSGTAEGQICWDTDNDTLYIGDSASATAITGGGSSTLSGLSDITITSVGNNEVLQYSTGTSQWINQTFSEAGIQSQDTLLDSIASLTDPNADKILFWDDGGSIINWLEPSTGLSIVGTDLKVGSLTVQELSDADYGDWSCVSAGPRTCTLDADVVDADALKDTDSPSDEECLTYEATGTTFEWQSCGGGSSLASLSDVTISSATTGQLLIYQTTDWQNKTMSGDVAISATGVAIVGNDSHTHGTSTISGLDISDDTNLAVSGTLLNLSGDTLSVNEGTLTNNKLCIYVSGTGLVCNNDDADTTLSQEQVEDYVGAMVSGNTETHITVTYQDADGTIDYVVSDDWWDALGDISLNSAFIIVGNGSNVGAAVDMTGDVDIDNTGATTIQANSVALTTDTTGNYAAGDGEAGNALTGDSATAFFSAGTIEHEYGGLEADVSAYSGLLAVSGGATYEVDSKSELETQIADVVNFCEADGDVYTGVHDFGGATSIEIVNAAAPTVNAAGEIAIDTTSDQLKYYGGAERVMTYKKEICFALENPVAADDNVPFFFPRAPITITDVYCQVDGGTALQLTISDGSNALEAITCDTDGAEDDGSIVNGTFTSLERMELDIGTVTGTNTWLNGCVTYTIDAD